MARSAMVSRRSDPRQLTFNWSTAVHTDVTTPPKDSGIALETKPIAAAGNEDQKVELAPLVQHLAWDFRTTFPNPLEDAIESGVVDEDDVLPENLAALHENQAQEMLRTLSELEAVHDARRRGVNPKTGRMPRQREKLAGLAIQLTKEIEHLERWQQSLLDAYEAAFGDGAARAFCKYIRARHAGIPVALERQPPPVPASTLPFARPLRAAINSAVFGEDENGAVDPSDEEIAAITEEQAERTIELIKDFRAASSDRKQQASRNVDEAIDKFASDFGREASEALRAYCHRQALLEDAPKLRPPG